MVLLQLELASGNYRRARARSDGLYRGLAAAHQHDALHDVVALIEAGDAEARLLADGPSSPCSNDPVSSTAKRHEPLNSSDIKHTVKPEVF